MLHPWSQQARQLTPRRGNSRASRESGLLCSQTVYIQRGHEYTQKEQIRGVNTRVRRHYGPLCATLVAAKSGSICIAVVLVSGNLSLVISLYSQTSKLIEAIASRDPFGGSFRGLASKQTNYASVLERRVTAG